MESSNGSRVQQKIFAGEKQEMYSMDKGYKAGSYRIVNSSEDFWNNFLEEEINMPISAELPDALKCKLDAAVMQAADKMKAAKGSWIDIGSMEMEAWLRIEIDEKGRLQYGIAVILVDVPECRNSVEGYILIQQDDKCYAEFRDCFMWELERQLFE